VTAFSFSSAVPRRLLAILALTALGLALSPVLRAGVLLGADFNAPAAWPSLAALSTGGATATAASSPAGTIDGTDAVPSAALALTVNTVNATAPWSATLASGRLGVANTESHLGKLTLSFDLASSLVRPVRIRVQSFVSATAAIPTGTLEILVVPPVAGSYYRHSLDLSAFSPAGPGAFDPLAPFVQFQFELASADTPEAWPADPQTLRLDNLSFTSPAFYVSATAGNNSADGRTESRALATIQRAVDLAQPGDVIVVMDGTYTANVTWLVTLFKAGTPSRWIVVRAHPDRPAPHLVAGANTWAVVKMDHTSSYIEVRGLVVRGRRALTTLAEAEANYAAATVLAAFNGNGIDVDGRQGAGARRPHHLRFIGCEIYDHCGGGISAITADYVTAAGNTVYNNCWYMRYAGSGISYLTSTDVDGTAGTANLPTKLFILGNTVYRNQCFVKWKSIDKLSDGNGIIVDTNKSTLYAGRTLVQNNVAFGNGGSGLHVYDVNHVDLVHNTAYYNGQSPALRWGEIFVNRGADVTLANNILWASSGRPINSVGNSNPSSNVNVTYTNNLYYGDGANFLIPGVGDLRARPLFRQLPALLAQSPTPDINAVVGPFDFRLRPSSPGIDAASPVVPGAPRADLTGAPRPVGAAPDCGAYETPALVVPAGNPLSRLVNLSVRTALAPGQILIAGFATSGAAKSLLVRGVGPGLEQFLAGSLADPRLALYNADATKIDDNDDWPAALAPAFSAVGAFPLSVGSGDAALRRSLAGGHTAHIAGAGPGIVLLEVYDTETASPARLVNLSARNRVTAVDGSLIAGFVIGGTGPKGVLIRGLGPALVPFGVADALTAARLDVFSGPARLTDAEGWDPALAPVFASVGAFALAPRSADTALVLSLAPGAYTVKLSAADARPGDGLIEVYELP